MADNISIEFDNLEGFAEAARLAPKKIYGNVRQEFRRAGNVFRTEARKALLFGPPGIRLPAAELKTALRGKNKGRVAIVRGRAKDVKIAQQSHIIIRTGGSGHMIFLVAYTSKFLSYHSDKLLPLFRAMFRSRAAEIHARVAKEAARTMQLVLDQGLRDKSLGRKGNPTRRLSQFDFDETRL